MKNFWRIIKAFFKTLFRRKTGKSPKVYIELEGRLLAKALEKASAEAGKMGMAMDELIVGRDMERGGRMKERGMDEQQRQHREHLISEAIDMGHMTIDEVRAASVTMMREAGLCADAALADRISKRLKEWYQQNDERMREQDAKAITHMGMHEWAEQLAKGKPGNRVVVTLDEPEVKSNTVIMDRHV